MLILGNAIDELIGAESHTECLRVALLTLANGPGDDFDRWVVTDVGALIGYLRSALAPDAAAGTDTRPIAVVVWSATATSVWQEAAMEACWQAVRRVVHSLILERGARDMRLNAIRSTEDVAAALRDTLIYLASKQAGFVAGSSIDLRPTS